MERTSKRNGYEHTYHQGNWNIAKGKLKQRWANLTDNDLTYVEGQEDELVGQSEASWRSQEAIEKVLKEKYGC